MTKQQIRKEFMIENNDKDLTWFSNQPFDELVIYCKWLENRIIEMDKDVIRKI